MTEDAVVLVEHVHTALAACEKDIRDARTGNRDTCDAEMALCIARSFQRLGMLEKAIAFTAMARRRIKSARPVKA